jgi:hypothetical protein
MGRFVGFTITRGGSSGAGGGDAVQEFDRSTDLTVDGSNNVTSITLGELEYSNLLYSTSGNSVGLVTSFTETAGGEAKNYEISYDPTTYDVLAITEVV